LRTIAPWPIISAVPRRTPWAVAARRAIAPGTFFARAIIAGPIVARRAIAPRALLTWPVIARPIVPWPLDLGPVVFRSVVARLLVPRSFVPRSFIGRPIAARPRLPPIARLPFLETCPPDVARDVVLRARILVFAARPPITAAAKATRSRERLVRGFACFPQLALIEVHQLRVGLGAEQLRQRRDQVLALARAERRRLLAADDHPV